MRISILDQSPISSNQSAQDALYESMNLAQAGEKFGYTRYWIAEHHDLPGLACPAPEIMLGFIGAHTSKIRIGSGATLLPHYKPYKVAETFNLLATLFPNRIDIGIGRAPGGSAEATNALSDNFLQQVYKMPDLLDDLLHFLHHDFPENHEFEKVTASPVPPVPPETWLLGTSRKSAALAAKNGLAYAFGQFMSEENGAEIIQQYMDAFESKKTGQLPQALLTVSTVCAETSEKAEEVALSWLIWQLQAEKGKRQLVPSIEEAKKYELTDQEKEKLHILKQNMIIGNPQEVGAALHRLRTKYETEELMILTITHSPQERINSYRLIAEEVL
ncbi:luciferase [Virgibacillus soli]|uniref:Luciferase n=1 Tax=Lederbergia galactosidilytica TaxID=217031 RepID=A0A0Q9XQN7_9BACI|nr:LLM class flavin-dependent oxidoreductase [Lederbergia galactosidilytica]KRG09641.1 luciferase [Lederbergia galactosidilytica]KRG14623.1 luciferase [Virgibacillus soli]MBP1916386.1 luciferase family oxidoreductase group 1 [Lederbergia galactosidilytica]